MRRSQTAECKMQNAKWRSREGTRIPARRLFASLRVTVVALVLGLALCAGFAQAVTLDIPDSLYGNTGDTIDVPVLIFGQTGRNILGIDITLGFRDVILTATDAFRLGAAANGWMAAVNPYSCSLLVAMANANPLAAGDTLIVVRMVVDAGDTSRIPFLRCKLNEGAVPCTTFAGMFYGYGAGVRQGGRLRASTRVTVAPNPVREVVRLFGLEPVQLVSADGQKVMVLKPGLNRVADLPRGVYFCRSESGDGSAAHKLVVQR